MYKLIVVILFILLSPGVILTLPAGSKGVFFSGQTSISAAIVHSLVFVVCLTLIKYYLYLSPLKEKFSLSCPSTSVGQKCNNGKICKGIITVKAGKRGKPPVSITSYKCA